jgi:hypothetical protein
MANNYNQATISPALPASLLSEAELQSLAVACDLQWKIEGDDLHLFAETFFSDEGEDEQERKVDLVSLLQAKLRQLDMTAYPHITIHGASTCDKMRADEFGGFAYVITRENVRIMSTWQWLANQTRTTTGACDPLDATTIRIEIRGGVVQDVSNIPPGWNYEIVDHDDLACENR